MKWLLASALLLAIGMVAAGVTAGRTLRERDAAVREGVLLRASHDIERELRERGPNAAAAVLAAAVHDGSASAIELWTRERMLHRSGTPRGQAVDAPLFLGPSWRALAGSGAMMMGRGQPPFRLRIWPASGAGDSTRVAAMATWGSILAALSLLAFAIAAARGVAARQHASALEAERHRLEVVSAAGAGLAHRIRNPLATIKATAQVLESQLDLALRDRARRIVDASVRIEALVDELLSFARPVEVHAETIDLSAFSTSAAERVLVRADREHITAAVEELVANAQHAGDARPDVVVRSHGRNAMIEVRDRGAGLTIDTERAFDPYVTTRADGTGLGLPTIRALMRANGGDVTLAVRDGGGCIATIVLPAVSA